MPVDLTALVLAAVADPSVADRHLWVIERALDVTRAEADLAVIAEAKVFPATLVSVARLKRTATSPGKLSIELRDAKGDQEHIETDWLHPGSMALRVARKANALTGELVLVWKRNEPDPTGKVSQGFRQCVWIDRHPSLDREVRS